MTDKIIPLPVLLDEIKEARKWNLKIAFTNGCFDILHVGHIKTFDVAKDESDILIVGLNSDASVRRLKGEDRPWVPQTERAEILAAIETIDYIVMFDEDTPANLIEAIRPDVLVKGADYEIKNIVGAKTVIESGGKVVRVPILENHSTSRLIKKLEGER